MQTGGDSFDTHDSDRKDPPGGPGGPGGGPGGAGGRRGQRQKQKRWQHGSKTLYDPGDSIDTQDSHLGKYRTASSADDLLDSTDLVGDSGTLDTAMASDMDEKGAERPLSTPSKSPLMGDTTRCLPYDCDTTIDDSVQLIDFSADDKADDQISMGSRSMSIGHIPTLPRRSTSRSSIAAPRSIASSSRSLSGSRRSISALPSPPPPAESRTSSRPPPPSMVDMGTQCSDPEPPVEPLRSSSRVSAESTPHAPRRAHPSSDEPTTSGEPPLTPPSEELPPPPPPETPDVDDADAADRTESSPPAYSLSDAKSTDV